MSPLRYLALVKSVPDMGAHSNVLGDSVHSRAGMTLAGALIQLVLKVDLADSLRARPSTDSCRRLAKVAETSFALAAEF